MVEDRSLAWKHTGIEIGLTMVLPQGFERMAGLASGWQQCAKSQRPLGPGVIPG
jgi:hypothetical protein